MHHTETPSLNWHQTQHKATETLYTNFSPQNPIKNTVLVKTIFSVSNKLYIINHSGLHDHFGYYYGWVIANDSGIIVTHKGYAPENHKEMDSC